MARFRRQRTRFQRRVAQETRRITAERQHLNERVTQRVRDAAGKLSAGELSEWRAAIRALPPAERSELLREAAAGRAPASEQIMLAAASAASPVLLGLGPTDPTFEVCARTPGGRAVAVTRPDKGTVELRAHRRALAGSGGDPTKTTCPLDILVDRGLIAPDAARAASWFRRLAVGFLGRAHPKSSLNFDPAGEMDEERVARLSRAYIALARQLAESERRLLLSMVYLAEPPTWLMRAVIGLPLSAADLAAKREAMQAIGALLNAWLRRSGGAAE